MSETCPKLGKYHLINYDTGELIQLPCKTYACEVCGPKKAYRLQKRLEAKFELYDYVRLFTFTTRTTVFYNQDHAIRRIGEIWRRFINNVRRDSKLNKKLRNFQYVKVVEFTKKGYPHYHVLSTCYMPQKILWYHWNNAINQVMERHGYNGSVNAKGMLSSRNGAKYVAKYVTKTARDYKRLFQTNDPNHKRKLKLYTKSGEMKLFYPSSPLGDWGFLIIYEESNKSDLIYKRKSQLPEKSQTLTQIQSNAPPKIENQVSSSPNLSSSWAEIYESIQNQQFSN